PEIFYFQAEDGIRDFHVTGVQTCALPILTMLLGFGTPLALVAAMFHLLNHATFKAALFMSAGIIDHAAHTRDIRQLGGLRHLMRSEERRVGKERRSRWMTYD